MQQRNTIMMRLLVPLLVLVTLHATSRDVNAQSTDPEALSGPTDEHATFQYIPFLVGPKVDPVRAAGEEEYVVRVYYNEVADIERLADYDVWEYNNLSEGYVLAGVTESLHQALVAAQWRTAVDVEATAALQRGVEARAQAAARSSTFLGGYRTVDTVYADLATIQSAHPTITEIVDYGDSYCKAGGGCTTPGGQSTPGYDLRAMRVTNQNIAGPKPVFFLMANIHAREITTPELAMRLLDWLVTGYGADADATWLVDWHEIWIVPVANPDGHWIVELGPYFQRKNANRSNGCSNFWPPSSSSQYGVDLNRNHSFGWNTGGTTNNACGQTYRGPAAASEPEVDQLQTLVRTLIPDQRGPSLSDPAPNNTTGIFITLHSYSRLVLWPWGNTTNLAPNASGLQSIGEKFATYNNYTPCQPSLCLYLTSGTSDDWSYGELGAPSFTFEVGDEFMPPYSDIDANQWPDNGPALIYAAKLARTPYMTVLGPDALNVGVSGSAPTLTLAAQIDDSNNGGQSITGALYYVDTPPWAGGAGMAMSAVDGAFNSSVEAVTATIDVGQLTNGQHIVYVQGQESAGNTGAVSAAFFTVTSGNGNTPPSATFTYQCTHLACSFDASGSTDSDGTIVSYSWNFGDGAVGSGVAPNHTYNAAGSYLVQLNVTDDGGASAGYSQSISVTRAMHVQSIDVIVSAQGGPWRVGQATVQIVNEAGQAVANATVSGDFSGDSSAAVNGVTNGSGQVVVTAPRVRNGAAWTFCVTNVAAAGHVYVVTANLETCDSVGGSGQSGTVAGQVVDASTSLAIAGASVSVDSGQSATTDGSGNYTLNGVATGTRTVTTSAAGYVSQQQQTSVNNGATSTLNFQLTPDQSGGGTGTIKGTVTNAATGAKLGGVTVVTDAGQSTSTNKGGKYTLNNVPAGVRTVTASLAGYSSAQQSATVVAGQTVTVNISLQP